jgi:hypothetical protein
VGTAPDVLLTVGRADSDVVPLGWTHFRGIFTVRDVCKFEIDEVRTHLRKRCSEAETQMDQVGRMTIWGMPGRY